MAEDAGEYAEYLAENRALAEVDVAGVIGGADESPAQRAFGIRRV